MPLLDHVLLHDRAFVGICRRHRGLFLEVFLVPFSNVNDIIMPMSDAVSSEVSKTIGIQKNDIWPCPLRTEIYSVCC